MRSGIDREKLRVALRRLRRDRLRRLADGAMDLVPKAKLGALVRAHLGNVDLAPSSPRAAAVLAEVKKFPEELRTALLNIQSFGWQHPVAWAIKKGIRDAKRLNRIAYFGSNGTSLGYCAPQTARAC